MVKFPNVPEYLLTLQKHCKLSLYSTENWSSLGVQVGVHLIVPTSRQSQGLGTRVSRSMLGVDVTKINTYRELQ